MPRAQQAIHNAAWWFMCVLFGGLLILSFRIFLPAQGGAPRTNQIAAGLIMMAVSISAIVMQFRFRNRIIKEFRYDGRALRFSTLGVRQTETCNLSEIETVADWQGRGGSQGFKLRLRGGKTVYLSNAVANSGPAIARIQRDLGPVR